MTYNVFGGTLNHAQSVRNKTTHLKLETCGRIEMCILLLSLLLL